MSENKVRNMERYERVNDKRKFSLINIEDDIGMLADVEMKMISSLGET